MLEDRLSHTYSQHSLGGYRTSLPQAPGMYPSIPTDLPSGQGGAESYYNTNAAPHGEPYTRPQVEQNIYPSPQSPYLQRDRIPSTHSLQWTSSPAKNPQRAYQSAPHSQPASSFQTYPSSPTSRQDAPYLYNNQYQSQQQPQEPAFEQQLNGSFMPNLQTPTTYTADPTAALHSSNYYPGPLPQHHLVLPGYEHGYVAPTPSSEQPHSGLVRQQQPAPQPAYQASIAQQPPQQQQNHWPQGQQYSQQPQQDVPMPQQQQPDTPSFPHPSMTSYTRDSFPSAPQHQPLPKPVEESLIEL